MRSAVALVVVAAALVAGCGGEAEDQGLLADRVLRLGEDPKTVIEVRRGEAPAGLSAALNPEAASGSSGSDLVNLPVHNTDDLVGSFRIERPDGVISFWLIYDHAEEAIAVEQALMRELDETPWQVIAGQSTGPESGLRFQSSYSGDIEGTAIIRSVLDADAEGGPITSVVYIVEVRPAELRENASFELPPPRPVPEDFPAPFLLLEGMTPVTVLWGSSPAGRSYQLVLLTLDSAFEVVAQYREVIEAEGWDLVDDRAVGFATVLEFETDAGATQGTLTADTFGDDDRYTSVLLELRVSSGGAN